MTPKSDYFWLGVLTLVALLLRLAGNGLESIWYDEAVSLILATTTQPVDLSIWRVHDSGNPAGYFLFLRGWLWLWGDASIETARALSAVTGALSVPAVWLLARAVGAPRRAGLVACVLVAVSPPLVYLSQEARVFALFATLVTLLTACAAWIQRTDRPAAWIGFAVLGAIHVHMHYYAFFVLTALGIGLLVWAWPRRWRPLFKLAGAAAFVGLAFLPWLDNFRWQMSQGATRSAESWWQQLAFTPAASIVGHTLVWKDDGPRAVAIISVAVIVLVYVPALWLLVRARIRPGMLFSLLVGVPLLLVLFALAGMPMINYRYLSALFPALMLALAWGLALGSLRLWQTWIPVAALFVLMAPALARIYLVRHKPDWRGVASHIERLGSNERIYLYEDHGTSEPLLYYRPNQAYTLIATGIGEDGSDWDKSGIAVQMRGEKGGFWLVLFLTTESSKSELPAILKWAQANWQVEFDDLNKPMQVLYCRPHSVP
jgi:uncharacterized membrane protein